MEQRITAIEPQERRRNRRSIFLDGKFALGVDEAVIADLGLHVGQQISEDELNRVVRAELVTKARDRALKLLEYRKRSRAEIAQRLSRAGFAEDVIEETVTYLEKLGFVDDTDFSESWVRHRTTGSGMGKTRIKWELRQKGVAASVIDDALEAVDSDEEYQSAMNAAMRRWQGYSTLEEPVRRRRLVSFLQRQGFDWETINRVLNELTTDSDAE